MFRGSRTAMIAVFGGLCLLDWQSPGSLKLLRPENVRPPSYLRNSTNKISGIFVDVLRS